MSSNQNRISTGLATDEGSPVPFGLFHRVVLDASPGVVAEVPFVCSGNVALDFSGGVGFLSGTWAPVLGSVFGGEAVGVDAEEDEEIGSKAVVKVRMVSTDERAAESGMDEPFVRIEEPPFPFGAAADPLTFVLSV